MLSLVKNYSSALLEVLEANWNGNREVEVVEKQINFKMQWQCHKTLNIPYICIFKSVFSGMDIPWWFDIIFDEKCIFLQQFT